MKAKVTSLWSQIFMACWIAGWSAFKFIETVSTGQSIDISDILLSGVGVAASFSPVYFSIVMDKIKDIRFGNIKEQ